jgi:hypothetical protein
MFLFQVGQILLALFLVNSGASTVCYHLIFIKNITSGLLILFIFRTIVISLSNYVYPNPLFQLGGNRSTQRKPTYLSVDRLTWVCGENQTHNLRGARRLLWLHHSQTMWLRHSQTMWLHHSQTMWLHHSQTMWLHHSQTMWLHHSQTMWLHHSQTIALLYFADITVRPLHCYTLRTSQSDHCYTLQASQSDHCIVILCRHHSQTIALLYFADITVRPLHCYTLQASQSDHCIVIQKIFILWTD